MPKLFEGYCHATIDDVANFIHSRAILPSGDYIDSVTNTATVVSVYDATPTLLFEYTPPDCTVTGYPSYTGITIADTTIVAWGVVTVWALAWGIRFLTRAAQ